MLTLSRKQRLRTLESEIRDLAESITSNGIEIGRRLCEIRDDELWSDDYPSWNQYLKEHAEELVNKSFTQAAYLIRSAEIEKRLPNSADVRTNLGSSQLAELGRLAPTVGKNGVRGTEKDYSQLRKQDIARVLKKAAELAGGESPSVRDIRKAVDADLGIDRAAKAKETKEKKNQGVDIVRWINDKIGTIEGIREALKENIKTDVWDEFIEDNPQLVKRFTTACDSLIRLFRKDV